MSDDARRWPGYIPLDHVLERPGGEPPLEGVIWDEPYGTRRLIHVLPAGAEIDVITTMDGGVSAYVDGRLLVGTPDYPDRGWGSLSLS